MNLFHESKKVLDKDGKVNPLGPYGKQKLTGREVSTYFRRNKVKDAKIKKAVEVALDLGGAMNVASSEIKKFFGDNILKSKEVQNALKYANEDYIKEKKVVKASHCSSEEIENAQHQVKFNEFDTIRKMWEDSLEKKNLKESNLAVKKEEVSEDYKKVIKMYPRDNDWKKLITKHKKAIDDFRNEKRQKDLPKKVEDELVDWAATNGQIGHKDDVEDFIQDILDEETNLFDTYRQMNYHQQDTFNEASAMGMIDKLFNLKGNRIASLGVAKLLNMTGVKVAQAMQKQNPKGFLKTVNAMGKETGKMTIPTNKAVMKMFKDQGVKPLPEETISENYRTLARKGMGAEDKKSIKVGREVDYYEPKKGDKRQGKITKMTAKGYTVQDDQDRKTHTFMYHDRMQAKKLLAASNEFDKNPLKGFPYNEETNLTETKKQEVDAMKKISKDMQSVLKAYQKVSTMGDKTLKDTKHNASYKKVLDARDAILTMIGTLNTQMLLTREETNLWAKLMTEEMITYRVKKMQKPELDKFQKSAKMMRLKLNFDQGKDDTVLVVSGSKKKLRDFDSVVRGKSSYGDPSTIKHFDEK